MNVAPFAFELAVAIVLILAVAAWTLSFVLRAGEGGAEPISGPAPRSCRRAGIRWTCGLPTARLTE
jgi:hypothetical protein